MGISFSKKTDNPAMQWWMTIFLNFFIFLIALVRWDRTTQLNLMIIIGPLMACIFIFGVRILSMKLAAKACGASVRFRAWESGFVMSFLVAIVFGGWFPIIGNIYPDSDEWRYRDLIKKLGPIALAGVLAVLITTSVAYIIFKLNILPPDNAIWMENAIEIGVMILLFDLVLIFFPFDCYNGRRIWDWNRVIWILLVISAVLILTIALFLEMT